MIKSIVRFTPLALVGAMLALAGAHATVGSDDETFIKKAAQGGMAEVELGKLAEQKSTNPEVKSFAARMVRDHSAADRKLTALAASKGVELPSGKGMGNDATYLKLKVLSGKSFDKAYVNAMVDDHKEDVADFEKQSNEAQDPDVKMFATKTLPTLKSHLDAIQKIQSNMGTD
jgi:putative membrane protein